MADLAQADLAEAMPALEEAVKVWLHNTSSFFCLYLILFEDEIRKCFEKQQKPSQKPPLNQ